jgi:hypothetical protein
MRKPTTLTLMLGLLILSWLPSLAWGASDYGSEQAWGQPESFLRSPFVAAFDPSHRLYQLPRDGYAPDQPVASFLRSPFAAAFDPAPGIYLPPLYNDKPDVPPGMCRWERFVLDGYGRPLLDPTGQPVKEYSIAPCP